MKLWKKLELVSKAIILFSIGFQLIVLSEFTAELQRRNFLYLMENQSEIASIIYWTSRKNPEGVSEGHASVKLRSEWDSNNVWNGYIRISNIIFACLFIIGSILSIVARYLELQERK